MAEANIYIGQTLVKSALAEVNSRKSQSNGAGGGSNDSNGTPPANGAVGAMPNPNQHISAADSEVAGGQNDLRLNNEAANARTDDIRAQGVAVDPLDLNKNQYRNYAKTDDNDDNLNNRGFNHTLSLSRQADAYNNKPRYTNVRTTNGNGGHTYVDSGLERPKLETQEMRQMRTNEQLSARQRQLRQDLQHLVNRKDYDLFVAWYQQKFGLNLSLTQAEQAVISFNRTQQIANIISQNHQIFMDMLRIYVSTQIASYMVQQASAGNYIWCTYFLQAYGMSLKPSTLMDKYEEDLNKELQKLATTYNIPFDDLVNTVTGKALSGLSSKLR